MRTCLPGCQRGVALLLALWALALLSVLMLEIVTTVRLENRQSVRLLQNTRAELAAEAGLAVAVLNVSDPRGDQRWRANGEAHTQAFDRSQVTVRIRSEMGKVDLNSASPAVCARLARLLGASDVQASQLAAGLEARQANAMTVPLRVLEEAIQLPGMSPELFDRLQPYITVWTGYDEPVATFAQTPVRLALDQPGAQAQPVADDTADPGPVLSIDSEALSDTGARATLSATLLLTLDGSTQAARMLRWQP